MKIKIIERKGEELQETTYTNIVQIEHEAGDIELWNDEDEVVEEFDEDDILYFSEIVIIKK